MSAWKDALCDYMMDNQPENYDQLSREEKSKVDEQLIKDFTEGCEKAEALWDGDR